MKILELKSMTQFLKIDIYNKKLGKMKKISYMV